MKPMTIIKYVFTGVGSGLLIAAFFFYQSTENFIQGALTADGVVTELIRSKSDNSTTYKPVVEFTTQNGTVVEITSSASSNPPMYTRGEAVEVFYHADSPQNGVINGFFRARPIPDFLSGQKREIVSVPLCRAIRGEDKDQRGDPSLLVEGSN